MRTFFVPLATLLLILSFSMNAEVTPPATGGVTLPRSWDDAIISRIKEGKSPRMVLAVLDFEGAEKLARNVDVTLSDMVTTSLVTYNRFDLVERSRIEKVMKEQRFQVSGLVDESHAVEVGKLLGAEAVIFGGVTSVSQTKIDKFAYDVMKTEVGIDVRVVNVTTGKVVLASAATGVTENKLITTASGTVVSGATDDKSGYGSALRQAIDEVANKISQLNAVVGFVVDVKGNLVTLDLGSDVGIAMGSKFVAVRVGDEIVHPLTKKRLGWKKEVMCEITVRTVEKSLSYGIISEIAIEKPLLPGDLVVLRENNDK